MSIQKALHLRDDIDNVSGKERERELARIEDCADVSIQRLEEYIKNIKKKLITAASNSNDILKGNRKTKTKKQKWEENNCRDTSSD